MFCYLINVISSPTRQIPCRSDTLSSLCHFVQPQRPQSATHQPSSQPVLQHRLWSAQHGPQHHPLSSPHLCPCPLLRSRRLGSEETAPSAAQRDGSGSAAYGGVEPGQQVPDVVPEVAHAEGAAAATESAARYASAAGSITRPATDNAANASICNIFIATATFPKHAVPDQAICQRYTTVLVEN